MMTVKFKKLHPDAVIPTKGTPGAAGYDLTAISCNWHKQNNIDGQVFVYGTGLALELPPGTFGAVYPRSSVRDRDMFMANGVGVVDCDYRGEIFISMRCTKSSLDSSQLLYRVGDKIAQLIIRKCVDVEFVESELSNTERGVGGHGSTGT